MTSNNGWEEYRMLVLHHMEADEQFQRDILVKLAAIDKRLEGHMVGTRVFATIVPVVISTVIALVAIIWGN